jgi:hypothetical protein
LVAKAEVESRGKISCGGRMIEMRVGGRVDGVLGRENLNQKQNARSRTNETGTCSTSTRGGVFQEIQFENLS